jgi:hypothetical protein
LYSKFTLYGIQYPRIWATKVLRPPNDTIYTKTGLAIKSGTLYIGNGTYWSQVAGGGTWGSITGTLSNQTDLQNALNLKLNVSDTTGKWVQTLYTSASTNQDTLIFVKAGSANVLKIFDEPDGLISGGIVSYSGTGLVFDVSPAIYRINGIRYTSSQTQITLDPSDPSNPRRDAIALDATGVIKVTGTAASSPADPQMTSDQIALTFVSIAAGATTPTGTTTTTIWDENTEWTGSASGVTASFTNTTNPFHLTRSTDVGGFTNGQYIRYTNGASVSFSSFTTLKFYLRLKATFAQNTQLQISFTNSSGVNVTSVVNLTNNNYGYVRTITGSYQTITIPMTAFIPSQDAITGLKINLSGSNASGFYIDWIQLQGGITQTPTGTVWGNITGVLSNQTDLQNAFNLKLNISDTTNKWVWAQGNYNTMSHQTKNTWYDSTKLRRASIANEDSAHFDWWWKGDNDPSWTYFYGKNLWVSDNDTVTAANDDWPYGINTNATFQRVTRLNPDHQVGYRFNLMANQIYTNGNTPASMGALGGDVGASSYSKTMLKENPGTTGRVVINGGTPFFNATPVNVSILEVDGWNANVYANGYWAGYNSMVVVIEPDSIQSFVHYLTGSYSPGFDGNIQNETGFYIDYSTSFQIPVKWAMYAPDAQTTSYNLFGGRVGVGGFGFGTHATPSFHSSAALQINDTARGFMTSRMTNANMNAISSPDTATFIWNIDSARYFGYKPGTGWKGLKWTDEGGGSVTPTLQEVTTEGNTTFNQIFITYSAAGTTAFSTINQNAGSAIYASNTGSGIVGNFEFEHASTNTVSNMISYGASTTGTAAAGLGQKHRYLIEADGGGSYEAASLNILWDDATEGTATSRVVFNTMGAGSVLNALTLNGNGQIQFNEYTGSSFNTVQAKVAMVGTDGNIYAVDTTGLFGGGGSVTISSVGGGLDIQTGGAGNIRTLNTGEFDVATNLISLKVAGIGNSKLANSTISGVSLGNNLNNLTAGYGILYNTGTTYNGGAAITQTVDTTSGGVTSWLRTKFIIDSLQAAGWGNQSVNNDYRYYIDMSASTHANGFFSSSGTGSSAPAIGTAVDGMLYGRDLQTGTTNTGRAFCLSASGSYSIVAINTSYRYSAGYRLRIPVLSNGTDRYGIVVGYMDDVNSYAAVTDGFGFRYIDTDSSGVWIAWAKDNGSITEAATSITVAANTNYRLQVTTIGGIAYYYIDGVLRATISSGVPSGTARATSIGMSFFKTVGTTNMHLYINEFGYDQRDN